MNKVLLNFIGENTFLGFRKVARDRPRAFRTFCRSPKLRFMVFLTWQIRLDVSPFLFPRRVMPGKRLKSRI